MSTSDQFGVTWEGTDNQIGDSGREVELNLFLIPVIHDVDSWPDAAVSSLGVVRKAAQQALGIISSEVGTRESDAIEGFGARGGIRSDKLQLN